ncbi:polyhydroxyalkanoate synthase [Modicisalibacter ilicicola DSM 19980]|uniref:Polyhydroxyalkanoate synthase n=1 Tax=Modicisalibacter ilicicola DSM 19980 TaxID=1121942 RepID=A0A1M5EKM8_9GAMM|nr:alpha/beta fold hydrolase [Halomonas ilicicola]SHF79736.1 polyhydroxyalkanoate synthase [Halomonas ilicicola DSM 19980]
MAKQAGRASRSPQTTTPSNQRPLAPTEADQQASTAPSSAEQVDPFRQWSQRHHAALAKFTAGLSPASIFQAYADWWAHLLLSPGKQAHLAFDAQQHLRRFTEYLPQAMASHECEPCIAPPAQDDRFDEPEWQQWPFNVIHQGFLLNQQWWDTATRDMPGMSRHHEDVVNFISRQLLDMASPANSVWTNPVVLKRTQERAGRNLIDGFLHAQEDIERFVERRPPAGAERFTPGETVAVTPGQVVYRNQLMELIQYTPTTEKVKAEPLLIVPAWIMKYYILDLSPENSLVRWLVDQGYTVFMISWKNPGPEERNMGIEDYRQTGIMEALEAVNAIVPEQKVHAVGYCLGGTLLSITAAVMARNEDDRLASLSLFASLTDFEEAGELELFIDESQVHFLEDAMREQGYLEDWQMKGAFQLLQSNDLVWSRIVREYLLGERMGTFDLMAWSTDGTRMPYKMHSQYLRRLYLDNALAQGRYKADGQPVLLGDIRLPSFLVATRKDHIAPWRSVYRNQLLLGGDITFTLTSGGHNAGVVSEPGHKRRVYQIADKPADAAYVDADTWHAQVPERQGSWWPEWHRWLLEHTSGESEPPTMGNPDKGYEPLEEAPGHYVLER